MIRQHLMNVLELDSGTTRENMKEGEGEGLERAKKTFKSCNVAKFQMVN